MKRTPLARGTSRLKRKAKLRASGNKAKKRERFRKVFGPEGFVPFVKTLPCVACDATPCEVHHEPTRSSGGRWVDTSPLCKVCHRRRHTVGVVTFWREVGKDYGATNRRTQSLWLAYRERESLCD